MYYIKNSISGGEADREFAYGRPEDTVYAGSWTAKERVPKLPEPEAADLQLNQSQGFTYSRLTLGFAGNAVNSTAFRKNAVVSHVDGGGNITQYCAYYDCYGTIVLAERENMGGWEYRWTGLQGDVTDAHNVISIAVDGAGYLHMAWSLHSGKLYYAVADSPGSMTCIRQR